MLSIQTKSDTVGIALIEKGVDANIVDKVKYLIHVLFPRTIFFPVVNRTRCCVVGRQDCLDVKLSDQERYRGHFSDRERRRYECCL